MQYIPCEETWKRIKEHLYVHVPLFVSVSIYLLYLPLQEWFTDLQSTADLTVQTSEWHLKVTD